MKQKSYALEMAEQGRFADIPSDWSDVPKAELIEIRKLLQASVPKVAISNGMESDQRYAKPDELDCEQIKAAAGILFLGELDAAIEGDRGVIDGYAPDPTNWLNQSRWKDDIEPPQIKENTRGRNELSNNVKFDRAHQELTDRIRRGEIQRGPDASDPFAD